MGSCDLPTGLDGTGWDWIEIDGMDWIELGRTSKPCRRLLQPRRSSSARSLVPLQLDIGLEPRGSPLAAESSPLSQAPLRAIRVLCYFKIVQQSVLNRNIVCFSRLHLSSRNTSTFLLISATYSVQYIKELGIIIPMKSERNTKLHLGILF